MGTTVLTATFGFFYWLFAANKFPPEAVGFASASISAMMLLGTIGVLGLARCSLVNCLATLAKKGPSSQLH